MENTPPTSPVLSRRSAMIASVGGLGLALPFAALASDSVKTAAHAGPGGGWLQASSEHTNAPATVANFTRLAGEVANALFRHEDRAEARDRDLAHDLGHQAAQALVVVNAGVFTAVVGRIQRIRVVLVGHLAHTLACAWSARRKGAWRRAATWLALAVCAFAVW